MRMLLKIALALLTAAYIGGMPVIAPAEKQTESWQSRSTIAEPGQNAPTVERPNSSNRREEFRMMMQQYQEELDQLSKDVADEEPVCTRICLRILSIVLVISFTSFLSSCTAPPASSATRSSETRSSAIVSSLSKLSIAFAPVASFSRSAVTSC